MIGEASGRHVDDAAPGAQQAGAREDREQLDRCGHLVLDHVERATVPVAGVRVHAGAHDELALVSLRDVDVHVVGHHDGRMHRLVTAPKRAPAAGTPAPAGGSLPVRASTLL